MLGAHMLGWRTVCAVEIERDCQERLLQRQREGFLPLFPIWDDVRTFDGRPWRGCVDIVSGGFPCTDISAAGKGAGIEGEESRLWKEMARIIGEVRPGLAWVENSPMLTGRGLGVVLGGLSSMGYDATWGVISSADAGGTQLRERIWILAHAYGFTGTAERKPWIKKHSPHSGWNGEEGNDVDVAVRPRNGDRGIPEGWRPQGWDQASHPDRGCSRDAVAERNGQGGDGLHEREQPRRVAAETDGSRSGQRTKKDVAHGPSVRRREGGTEPTWEQGRPDAVVGGESLGSQHIVGRNEIKTSGSGEHQEGRQFKARRPGGFCRGGGGSN